MSMGQEEQGMSNALKDKWDNREGWGREKWTDYRVSHKSCMNRIQASAV